MKGIPRAVWLITAVFGLLLVSYSVLFPIYRAPDEVNHVDMIWGIRNERRYPNFDTRTFSADVFASRSVARVDAPFHRLATEAIPRGQRPTFAQLAPYGPTTYRNQVAQHPPLYYALLAAPLFATPFVPVARDWSFDQVVGFLRFLSVLLVLPLPLIVFRTARRLYGSVPVATGAAAVPLAIPQLVHIGAAVNNDNLLTLLVGLLTAALAAVITAPRSSRVALMVGVLGGLALLTKGFALFIPAWVAGAYALAMVRFADRRKLLGQGATALVVMTVLGGWWWIRNLVEFGAIQPGIQLRPGRTGFVPDRAWWLGRFARNMTITFWSPVQGPGDPALPLWLSVTATAVVLLGAAFAFARGRGSRPLAWADPLVLLFPTVAIGAIVASGAWGEYARTGLTPGLQGRYLFGGITGVSVAFAAGASVMLGKRERFLPSLVLLAAAGIQVTIVVGALRAYWGPAAPLSVRESVHALLAWSPWPSAAVIMIWLLFGVASVALALAVIRQVRDVASAPRS